MRFPPIGVSMIFGLSLGACASSPPRVADSPPKSYRDRMAEADQHDRDAQVHERQAAEARGQITPTGVSCGNPVVANVADQSTSGGERISTWIPCWSVERDAAKYHQAEADRLHREARVDRGVARNLLEVEREFCTILPTDELTHTPFYHREDIAAVEPYVEGGHVKGARIHFKNVRGLDANWMRQALLCHRARAATIGYDPKYMAYDPTMLTDVNVAVTERKGTVDVLVRSDSELTTAVVLARAKALVETPDPPTRAE